MKDRSGLRGRLWRGPPIEPGVEDGFDGAIGPGADLDSALGGGLDARGAERAGETHDAETSAIPPARDGAGPPGSARKGPRSPADLSGVFPECARSSSRHSADGWKACAREWWCASGSRLPLCGRRCARPCGGSRRRGRSAALRPQRGRSGRGRSNSGRRCRRDSRRRPGADATRNIRRARQAAP